MNLHGNEAAANQESKLSGIAPLIEPGDITSRIKHPQKPCHNTFSLSLLFLPPFCLAFLLASFPSDDRKGGTSRKEYSLVRARLLTP